MYITCQGQVVQNVSSMFVIKKKVYWVISSLISLMYFHFWKHLFKHIIWLNELFYEYAGIHTWYMYVLKKRKWKFTWILDLSSFIEWIMWHFLIIMYVKFRDIRNMLLWENVTTFWHLLLKDVWSLKYVLYFLF